MLGLIGCLNNTNNGSDQSDTDDDWDPELTVPKPELEPGGETTVTVEATDTAGFHTPKQPNTTAITVEFEASEVAPTPSRHVETRPGYLYWDSREDIAVDVRVVADEDVEPASTSSR